MTNLYHITDTEPALLEEDMAVELEDLTKRLISSGLLRIDAFNQINFVHFTSPVRGYSTIFTNRELSDAALLPRTKEILRRVFSFDFKDAALEKKITQTINKLKEDLKKFIPISYDMELKLGRIIVQTSHPVVIELAILERVQMFISYSYNIGDVLDIPTWQEAGSNSGMQSTDGRNTAVYVSCGGDPLYIEKKIDKEEQVATPFQEEITYGPGKPALARALVIGGQEFGHYSDIIRDYYGRYVGRHSATLSGSKATPHTRRARLYDMENIEQLIRTASKLGLMNIAEDERHVKFYQKTKVKNIRSLFKKLTTSIKRNAFFHRLTKNGLAIFKKFKNHEFPATSIYEMFMDMKFNLAPDADVYKNPNKEIEEAIACIESLARVPQQCNKWGHNLTKFLYPELYKIYYNEVIPSCIATYENLTKKQFLLHPSKLTKLSYLQKNKIKLIKKIKAFFKKFFL